MLKYSESPLSQLPYLELFQIGGGAVRAFFGGASQATFSGEAQLKKSPSIYPVYNPFKVFGQKYLRPVNRSPLLIIFGGILDLPTFVASKMLKCRLKDIEEKKLL